MARVVVLDDNLFLRPRLTADLQDAGWTVDYVAGAERFRAALTATLTAAPEGTTPRGAAPDVVLVNLASRSFDWAALVGEARALHPAVPVIGFGPHVDEALAQRGLAAGCVEVVPNGAVAKSAARVVGRHTSGT
jgi:CheY-like chemotaxis protein